MPNLDFTYLKKFRGYLGWNAFTNGLGTPIPAVEIELYINNFPEPTRKPKPNEFSTISIIEPISQKEIGTQALFYGAPDPLQMELSGWTITTQVARRWVIKAKDGTTDISPYFGNVPYAEVIQGYLNGEVNPTAGGATQRKDPDYFITPQGYQYTSPLISSYQVTYTTSPKKQQFNMTLILES